MSDPSTTAGGASSLASPSMTLTCVDCGAQDQGLSGRCQVCSGMVEAGYPRVDVTLQPGDADTLETYRALLPIPDRSLRRIVIEPTPTVLLTELDGIPIYAKVEGVLPTGSTKDRLIAVALPLMLAQGITRFVLSSTGNTAAAYAWGLQYYPELTARAFVSYDVPKSQLGPETPALEIVRVDGDYVMAGHRSKTELEEGEAPEGGFFNLGRREGAKLAYLEAFDDIDRMGGRVDTVVQAVASGLGIVSAASAVEQSASVRSWGRGPRLFCAQQTSCAPMVRAWRSQEVGANDRLPEHTPEGLASAILLGDPFSSFDYVARAVRGSGGGFVDVTSSEIAAALNRHSHDVPLGNSAAVALSSVYRLWEQGDLRGSEGVLVALTGGPGR